MTALKTSARGPTEDNEELLHDMGVELLQPSTSREIDFATTLNDFAMFCLDESDDSLMSTKKDDSTKHTCVMQFPTESMAF